MALLFPVDTKLIKTDVITWKSASIHLVHLHLVRIEAFTRAESWGMNPFAL